MKNILFSVLKVSKCVLVQRKYLFYLYDRSKAQ